MPVKFRRRKNFLPALLVTIILWGILAIIFFFVPPETPLMPLLFLLIVFLTALFTGSLIFANTRRGVLLSLGILVFMLLNYYNIGNYLNLALLAGILVTLDYYLSHRN
ncbi:MAG: hypothetical protein HYT11_04885 [Candidatus Levybacteria bacterium]|nr:hypothetical protein [Candidatus Levybacteria bacterium]